MYCKNCGHELDDKAVVCPHCGVPVYDNFNGKPNVQNLNTNQYAPYDNKEKVYNVLAIIGFIFSIIGLGSLIVAVAGLICSVIGCWQAGKLGGKGKAFAIAGIVISSVAIVYGVVDIVLTALGIGTTYSGLYYYY